MKGTCFPRSAFCVLPSAFCLPPTAYCSADCLLHLGGVRVVGTLAALHSLRQDVTASRERKN